MVGKAFDEEILVSQVQKARQVVKGDELRSQERRDFRLPVGHSVYPQRLWSGDLLSCDKSSQWLAGLTDE